MEGVTHRLFMSETNTSPEVKTNNVKPTGNFVWLSRVIGRARGDMDAERLIEVVKEIREKECSFELLAEVAMGMAEVTSSHEISEHDAARFALASSVGLIDNLQAAAEQRRNLLIDHKIVYDQMGLPVNADEYKQAYYSAVYSLAKTALEISEVVIEPGSIVLTEPALAHAS